MVNDGASGELPQYNVQTVFSESFAEDLDPRKTQSCPNMSKTTLNDEIDYSLAGYKVNESSIADITPSSDKLELGERKFKSIKSYTDLKPEVQPKFLDSLNNSPDPKLNLNSSDHYEAQELIESLK